MQRHFRAFTSFPSCKGSGLEDQSKNNLSLFLSRVFKEFSSVWIDASLQSCQFFLFLVSRQTRLALEKQVQLVDLRLNIYGHANFDVFKTAKKVITVDILQALIISKYPKLMSKKSFSGFFLQKRDTNVVKTCARLEIELQKLEFVNKTKISAFSVKAEEIKN